MSIKPTEHQMNEYFARVEEETEKLTGERKKKHSSKEEQAKQTELRFVKCPKCGTDLIEIDSRT